VADFFISLFAVQSTHKNVHLFAGWFLMALCGLLWKKSNLQTIFITLAVWFLSDLWVFLPILWPIIQWGMTCLWGSSESLHHCKQWLTVMILNAFGSSLASHRWYLLLDVRLSVCVVKLIFIANDQTCSTSSV